MYFDRKTILGDSIAIDLVVSNEVSVTVEHPSADIVEITAVRLKVEENQLVGVFGKIGVRVDSLKCA